jgi:catechol 2,3-dioxygenase-like lactoylglutathione lyase family enzyme
MLAVGDGQTDFVHACGPGEPVLGFGIEFPFFADLFEQRERSGLHTLCLGAVRAVAACQRVDAGCARIALLGATDHGVNLAVYLRDPDGNGLELMLDRTSADWPRDDQGQIAMRVDPLDLRALVAEALRTA